MDLTSRGGHEGKQMPKIEAPTVAEHHKMRRDALIEAATRLLATGGVEAVTPAAVGAEAGLARSSFYQYFDSSAALLATVVEELMPQATADLVAATGSAADPGDRIDAYVRAYLEAVTDHSHRSVAALGQAGLPEECRARVQELHGQMFAPLSAAVADLLALQHADARRGQASHGAAGGSQSDPTLTARLILGILHAAAALAVEGSDHDQVLESTLDLVHGGLAGRH
jgi:AcrR family transcriptional regulator